MIDTLEKAMLRIKKLGLRDGELMKILRKAEDVVIAYRQGFLPKPRINILEKAIKRFRNREQIQAEART